MTHKKLIDVLPGFAVKLADRLCAQHREDLAAQVPGLLLVDRCRCDQAYCGTLYTVPPPTGSWKDGGAVHRNVEVEGMPGWTILDVVDGKICCIEALDQAVVRDALVEALP